MEEATLKQLQASALIALLACSTPLADFQYQQSTSITGGALQAMTRVGRVQQAGPRAHRVDDLRQGQSHGSD